LAVSKCTGTFHEELDSGTPLRLAAFCIARRQVLQMDRRDRVGRRQIEAQCPDIS
jgi:hypothetical protein